VGDCPRGIRPEIHERFRRIVERAEAKLLSEREGIQAEPKRREKAPWAMPRRREPVPTVPMEDGPGGWGSLED